MNTSVFLDSSKELPRTRVKVLKGSYPNSNPFAAMDFYEEGGGFVTLYLKTDQVPELLEKLEAQFRTAVMEYVDKTDGDPLDERELTNFGD